MRKKINKISIALSITLVFLGMMGMGQNNPDATSYPKTIQTWMYPGLTNNYPITTINQKNEFADGRVIDALKTQYLKLNSNGELVVQTEASGLVNAYSQANVQHIINNQNPSLGTTFKSYITISSAGQSAGFQALLNSTTLQTNFINFVVGFLNNSTTYPLITNFKGIELDLENPTDHWTSVNFSKYCSFIDLLGSNLKAMSPSRELTVTLPANDYMDYATIINNSNVTNLCLMMYDYYYNNLETYQNQNGGALPPANYDFGANAPNAWVQNIITYVKQQAIPGSSTIDEFNLLSTMEQQKLNKIIIGLPSYGYHASKLFVNSPTPHYVYSFEPFDSKVLTSTYDDYSAATRDPLSYEMKFISSSFPESHPVYFQDAIGISKKIEEIRTRGIRNVSIWCLGGNDWPTGFNPQINSSSSAITSTTNQYKLPQIVTAYNWGSTQYPLENAKNYDLSNPLTINQCTHVSQSVVATSPNYTENYIELSGYNFGLPVNSIIDGFEIAFIGHSNPLSGQNKSTFSIEVSNGQSYSTMQKFNVYSQHDIIKILGDDHDLWGKTWSSNPSDNNYYGNFKIRIKLLKYDVNNNESASAYLNTIYVKAFYHGGCGTTFNHTVAGNEIWNSNMGGCNEITVPANTTLTINSEARFVSGGYIDVKKGGALIIDGGTLTSCDNSWNGIKIESDYTKGQYNSANQGKVVLKNGATIKNAMIGIKTYNNNISNKGGGIIYACNANFINNKIAIEMWNYQNVSVAGGRMKDYSYFKKCNFIKDDNYVCPNAFVSFIELKAINSIDILGCKFANYSSNISSNFNNAGMGIRALDATFNIDKYEYRKSEFYNLRDAVHQSNTNIIKQCIVRNTIFANNFHAIFCANSSKNFFTSNTFQIPYYYSPGTNGFNVISSAYGLYLINATGYVIEGNSFDKIQDSPDMASYGLIIQGTPDYSVSTRLYNNKFSNIKHAATQAQGNNKGSNVESGLKILCNQYSLNNQDIAVIAMSGNDGISNYQGAEATTNTPNDKLKPAGNTFSHYGVNNKPTDLFSDYYNFTYFHHFSNNNFTDLWYPYFYNPGKILLINTTATFSINNRSEACPSIALANDSPYPYNPIQLNNLINQKTAQLNTAKLIYSIWVDNGNTEGLRHDIKISSTWDAFDLYNELLLGSPKLSDEVLIDAIKREDVLTPLMLKLILLANPQATRSERVWEALINRVNPLPDAWIDEIKQGLGIISPLENLEADVSYYANDRQIYIDLLKQYYLADTTGTGMNSYIQLLENETNIFSKYELVFAKILTQDFEGASTCLSNIEAMIDAEKQPEELERYIKMKNIIPTLINIESGAIAWEDLNSEERNYIIMLSEEGLDLPNTIAIAARKYFDTTFVFEEPIYIIDQKSYKMSSGKKINNNIVNESVLKISPNPAVDYIEVSYDITAAINGLKMLITDAMGKTVFEKELTVAKDQQIIIVKDFAIGNYICTIYNNGKPIQNTKFIKK